MNTQTTPDLSVMRGLAFDRATKSVLLRSDLPRPAPRPGEVLVRVTHATVNGHEFELAANPVTRFLSWIRRAPGEVRTGLEFAGAVETEGTSVRAGDRVMGYIDITAGWRTHADYLAIPEDYIAPIPAGLSSEQASALPMGGLTALAAVRDVAKVRPGNSVLIGGATGGVGLLGVQIARILGAQVTALGSAKHHDELRRLGAKHVVDYRDTPIASLTGAYDTVVDFSSTAWHAEVKHLLEPRGSFIPADPMRNLRDVLLSKQSKWLMVDRGNREQLEELGRWAQSGELEPIVDSVFPLERWEDAVARGHTRGRIGRTVLAFE